VAFRRTRLAARTFARRTALGETADREAVWAMVLSAAGLATMPAFRTLTLLGWNARLVELSYSMRRLDEMARRMRLPREWAY
jgi:hypothetical protein